MLVGALAAVCPERAARSQEPTPGTLQEEVRQLLTEWGARRGRGGREVDPQSLERLYERVAHRPVWTAGGRPTTQALGVIAAIDGSHARGLRPGDYDLDSLRAYEAALADGAADPAARVARFDVAVSHSLMRMLLHLHLGRVDPQTLGIDLVNGRAPFDVSAVALGVSRTPDVRTAIAAVEPPYSGYVALSRLLARYRALAADSAVRPPPRAPRSVRPGDRYADAPSLRRYLAALGDLNVDDVSPADTVSATRYDSTLVAAVVAFQRRHGLEPDGVLGPATVAQLRVPLAARVRQIEVTMERWRWLPNRPPPRYAVINIPGFRLYAFESDSAARCPALSANVIVGEARGHATPLFIGTMQEVIFRPYWEVPPRIARNELVPLIRRRPGYFDAEGFEIVRGYDEDPPTYAPTAGNLARVAAGTLRLRQRPGPKNALGLIKFVFPNRHNVYLHDTPSKELFARARRDFSHGCLRLQDPAKFAEFVLRAQAGWDRVAIEAAMNGTRTLRVAIQRPIVVYVVYATAGADDAGVAHFYADLYGHDATLAKLLDLPPVTAPSVAAPRP